jgi:hypothetical protein
MKNALGGKAVIGYQQENRLSILADGRIFFFFFRWHPDQLQGPVSYCVDMRSFSPDA